MSARVGVFTSSMRRLSHGTCSLQRVEKAVLGTRDFRLQRFWMRSLGALLSGRSGCPRLASQPSQFQCFIAGMKRLLILQLFGALVVTMADATTNFDLAAKATNDLAVDLHRQLATGKENLCISPYSIETALAMTFAGADGDTRTEMARVLHLGNDAGAFASFSALQHSPEEMSAKTAELVKQSKKFGGPTEPITLNIANRLFAQTGYAFRETFLSLVKQNFGGAFEPVDFVANPSAVTQHINNWVAHQT